MRNYSKNKPFFGSIQMAPSVSRWWQAEYPPIDNIKIEKYESKVTCLLGNCKLN
jgi:hypothetical protein